MPPSNNLVELLRCLSRAEVEYVLVGGLAAVLNGAPVSTFDVDIVHSREPKNVDRILGVLESLDAVFRIQPERRLRPNALHLIGPGHLNLLTRLGPLDVLGEIGHHLGFGDLFAQSSAMKIEDNFYIQVLNLETLIRLKEELGGAKDKAVLSVLRQTLEQSRNPRDRQT